MGGACASGWDRKVALVVLAFCVTSTAPATSSIILGVLWEKSVIPDVTHLRRSLDTMAGLNNESDVTIVMHDVTGISQNALLSLVCGQLTTSPGSLFVATVGCVIQVSLQSVARTTGAVIITITSGRDIGAPEQGVENYMQYPPTSPGLGAVMAALLTKLTDWKDVAVIYDEPTASRFDAVMGDMAGTNATLQAYKVRAHQEDADVSAILDSLLMTYVLPRHIVMLCSMTCQLNVIAQVRQYDVTHNVQAHFKFEDRWVLVADRFQLRTLEDALGWMDNVAVVVPLSLSEKSAESIVEEAVSLVLRGIHIANITSLTGVNPAAVCGPPSPEMRIVKDTIQLFVDQVVCDDCDAYEVVTMMYTHRVRGSSIVATWSPLGLTMMAAIFPNVHFGLNGRHLLISTNVWAPFVYYNPNSTLGYEGLSIELLLELARSANFTYNLTVPADGKWGGIANGSWNGLVGELQRKEIDLVVAPLSIQASRAEVIDYAESYYNEYTTVLAKLPDAASTKWSLYISPFKWQVWLSLACSIPFAGLVIWAFTHLSPCYTSHTRKSGLTNLNNAVLYTYGSLFTQGGIHLPSAQSGRFVVGFWWMYCIVVVATYSGNLIAFLTVSRPALPFDSLKDMVAQDEIKYGVMKDTAAYNELQESHNVILRQIWSGISKSAIKDPAVLDDTHGKLIDKVLAGGFAYMNDRTGFDIAMSAHCSIQMIKESFLPMPYSVAMQNRSAYESIFSREVVKVKEGGLITKWKQKWWPRQSFCSRGMVTQAKAVSLQDVQGAYYAAAMLLTCAFIALLTESTTKMAATWWKNRKLPKQQKTSEAVPTEAIANGSVNPTDERKVWGIYQSSAPEATTGVRDIYTNKDPLVDMYGHSINKEGETLNEPTTGQQMQMVDLLGRTSGGRDVVDMFGRITTVEIGETLDMFGRATNREPMVDMFGRPTKPEGDVDKYGRST